MAPSGIACRTASVHTIMSIRGQEFPVSPWNATCFRNRHRLLAPILDCFSTMMNVTDTALQFSDASVNQL